MNRIKSFMLLLGLFSIAVSQGQIVNIPDPNFKNALVNHDPVIDTNGDGEIQVSEAEVALTIAVFNENISDLTGVEAFINLRNLRCVGNNISEIDPTVFPFLQQLSFGSNNVSSIDVTQNPDLEFLGCDLNPITSLDLSNNPNLVSLHADLTDLEELDVSQNTQLEVLRLEFINATEIDLSNLSILKVFSMYSTDLASLDVSNNPQLVVLDISGTEINSLDLSNNPDLEVLDVSATNLTSLDISANLLLERLLLDGVAISQLDVSQLSNLRRLGVSGTNIARVDVSNNPQLCRLEALVANSLLSVNMKNGSNFLLDPIRDCTVNTPYATYQIQAGIDFRDSNSLEFICVDDVDFAEQTFPKIPAGAQFVDDCSLNVTEVESIQVSVAPNPAMETVRFTSETTIQEVRLYSLGGAILLTKAFDNQQGALDISSLSAGVYFMQLEGETGMETVQIVKK